MRIVWPPADAVCSLAARIDCLISSAVLPVSALACSALTNSTSASQLSHQIRVSDPHWRMIHTRSRSMVMRVVLLPVISYLSSLTCHGHCSIVGFKQPVPSSESSRTIKLPQLRCLLDLFSAGGLSSVREP